MIETEPQKRAGTRVMQGRRAAERVTGSIASCDPRQVGGIFAASSLFIVVIAAASLLVLRARPVYEGAQALGPLGRVALGGLARWDTGAYLAIAQHGYGQHGSLIAYFPLYSMVVGALSGFSSSSSLLLVVGCLVSLGSFLAALLLLRRLVVIEMGERTANATLLLLAFFPAALFFVAPYPHSLCLLLAVASLLAARVGRWPLASGLAAVASAARPNGITLLVPLVLLYLYGPRTDARPLPARRGVKPRYAVQRDAIWLAIVPLGLIAYFVYLWVLRGDPLAYVQAATGDWHLTLAPFAAVWKGALAAAAGVGNLLFSSPAANPVEIAGHHAYPTWVALQNVYLFGFLLVAVVAAAGVWRTLPVAYFGYVLANAVFILSVNDGIQPLMGLPRYLLSEFPLFMWFGHTCQRRRITSRMLVPSVFGLGAFTVAFAAGRWVA